MTCPKCHAPRHPQATECPYCQVVYARFEARLEPEPAALPPERALAPRESSAERQAALARAPVLAVAPSLAQREVLLDGLAQAIEAGMSPRAFAEGPLADALPRFVLEVINDGLKRDEPLSAVLHRARVLSEAQRAIVLAGERQGNLPTCFRLLAGRIRNQREDRRRFLGLMAYPSLLMLSAIILHPLPVIIFEGPAAYAGAVLPPLATFIAVVSAVLFGLPRLDPGGHLERWLGRLAMYVPPFEAIAWNRSLANFAHTLGTCVGAGISVREGLILAFGASNHPRIRRYEAKVVEALDGGATLGAALSEVRALPKRYLAFFAHAEQVGRLDEVLPRLAEEHGRRAKTLTTATAITGGVVGVTGVLLYLAYSVVSAALEQMNSLQNQLQNLLPF